MQNREKILKSANLWKNASLFVSIILLIFLISSLFFIQFRIRKVWVAIDAQVNWAQQIKPSAQNEGYMKEAILLSGFNSEGYKRAVYCLISMNVLLVCMCYNSFVYIRKLLQLLENKPSKENEGGGV